MERKTCDDCKTMITKGGVGPEARHRPTSQERVLHLSECDYKPCELLKVKGTSLAGWVLPNSSKHSVKTNGTSWCASLKVIVHLGLWIVQVCRGYTWASSGDGPDDPDHWNIQHSIKQRRILQILKAFLDFEQQLTLVDRRKNKGRLTEY